MDEINKNKSWPNNVFDEMHALCLIEKQLADLSNALWLVGQEKLSDRLVNFVERLNKIRENTKTAVANQINDNLKSAEEISKTILQAALLQKDKNGTISVPKGLEQLFK